jgi:hypothetical protein
VCFTKISYTVPLDRLLYFLPELPNEHTEKYHISIWCQNDSIHSFICKASVNLSCIFYRSTRCRTCTVWPHRCIFPRKAIRMFLSAPNSTEATQCVKHVWNLSQTTLEEFPSVGSNDLPNFEFKVPSFLVVSNVNNYNYLYKGY